MLNINELLRKAYEGTFGFVFDLDDNEYAPYMIGVDGQVYELKNKYGEYVRPNGNVTVVPFEYIIRNNFTKDEIAKIEFNDKAKKYNKDEIIRLAGIDIINDKSNQFTNIKELAKGKKLVYPIFVHTIPGDDEEDHDKGAKIFNDFIENNKYKKPLSKQI